MNNNFYWHGKGRLQKELSELQEAKFAWTKAEKETQRRYYRYYNDGDCPRGATYAPQAKVVAYLEEQATIAIAKAYTRMKNGEVSAVVKYYAQKKLKGYKEEK